MNLPKFADFALPHLHLAPPLGMIPFDFRNDFGSIKLESLGYRVILYVAVLIQYRLVTDTHTDRHTTMAYTALA